MKTRAAVAFEAKKPLEIVELDLEGPKPGEVLVEIMATGICHTDAYTLDGFDSEGIFPSVLGHEGAGVVREIGAGVTSLKPGDHVIPLYTPECRQCKSCLSGKTNLCTAIRSTQGQGVMPDGSSRFSIKGIGRWSAEIYLLFAEGRPDIWPAGDLAVQIEVGRIMGHAERPSEKLTREIAEPWRPHRGAAAILAWHHYKADMDVI